MTTRQMFAATWAAAWPDRITLDQAAEMIDFDTFLGEDPELVLTKVTVDIAELPQYSIGELADNDAEDRFTRLEAGLLRGGERVPPVVIVPGWGMRDGHHRVALAVEYGLTKVPAYAAA